MFDNYLSGGEAPLPPEGGFLDPVNSKESFEIAGPGIILSGQGRNGEEASGKMQRAIGSRK